MSNRNKLTPEEIAKREELEAKKETQQAQFRVDCERLLRQPEFMRYIKHVVTDGLIMHTVFTGNSETYYRSGRQDFARKIYADLAQVDKTKAIELLIPEGEE